MVKNNQIIITTVDDLGRAVREKRKKLAFTQAEAVAFCQVGTRFFSDLENGKDTLQIGKVLNVLKAFGLVFSIEERGLPKHSIETP